MIAQSNAFRRKSGLDASAGLDSMARAMEENAGSGEDLHSFYQRTVGPLRRYLARLLSNPTEAQDVAQDAFVRVMPHFQARSAQKPDSLLFVTARRLAFNRLRHRKVVGVTVPEDGPHPLVSPRAGVVDEVMARQEWAVLEQAIRDLPPGCRTVLQLRKVDQLSHQEIADRLGIAVSTVEKQHARALRLLREALPAEMLARLNSQRLAGGSRR